MMFRSIAITLGLALVTVTTQAYGNGIPSAELLITDDAGAVLFDQVITKDPAIPSALAVVWNPDVNVDPARPSFDYAIGNGASFFFLVEPTSSIPGPGDTVLATPYGYVTDILVYMPSYLTAGPQPAIGLFSAPHAVFSDHWTQDFLDIYVYPALAQCQQCVAYTFIEKTGDFQNMGDRVNFPPDRGIHVAVRSDIQFVPIPGAAWLFSAAICLLGFRRKQI
jgi:hypothetical protein